MGMDEVKARLQHFQTELQKFQDALQASIADTRRHHEIVSPMWQDAMRREYDAKWTPLEDAMEEYIRHVGPSQVETMLTKRRHAGRYLNGY